ncbi:MAG: hypothetical protein K0S33_970 [Bacteroidetes bacterium]|jgi:hypothetical protein|nr:hypothetical protein [Bacteroidota bacterium]
METTNNNETTFKITGDWSAQASQLKVQFAQLTDEDLKFEEGKEIELLERMESKLNKNREEVIEIIKKTEAVKIEVEKTETEKA